MSQRNFLRRQMIEYKELNGLRKGCKVSAIVHNQLEHGTVKWIGTIKGALYIGIEFERPVGNQFPETNGAAPFSCCVSHSRLVFPEDVRIGKNNRNKNIIMEYQQEQQDEDNYLFGRGVSPAASSSTASIPYLQLGGSCSDIGTDTDTADSLVMNRFNHSSYDDNQKVVDNVVNICDGDDDDSSEFVPAYSSSPILLSSSSSNSNKMGYGDGGDAIYANMCELSVQQVKEFDEKLSVFYKLCSQTKRLIKEYQIKYEELPSVHYWRFEDKSTVLNLNLERLKTFRGELRERIGDRLQQCKIESEVISRYTELLMLSEERKMSREIQDIEQSVACLDKEICSDIESLENFTAAFQNLQDLLQERVSRFAAIKTRLVQVERNLVKDESALSLRIKGMQSILSVLERDHDTSENSEISRLLEKVRYCDCMDISRVLSQTEDLMQAEKLLLQEVKGKRALLLEVKESYKKFVMRLSAFQDWYTDYMTRLNETKVTGPDFDVQHPSLVKEREEKRLEFIEILASAKSLRASIFDSSAVDKKIEALQEQWKVLVEKLYRARSRKTL